MAPLEYLGNSIEAWREYVALLALFLALHWLLVRRWTVGIFDPLLMLLVSNGFSWAIVWFMYLQGDIASVYVVSFTCAQLALYAGIGIGRLAYPAVVRLLAPDRDPAVAKLTLATAAVIHIVSTVSIWGIAGVPLFRASRLGAFEGAGGLGILERLSDSTALIAIFSAVYLLIHHRKLGRSFLMRVFVLWYLASIALSGSKGALLSVGQYVLSIVFVYSSVRYQKDSFWGGRPGKIGLGIATIFAIAVVAVQQEGDLVSALSGFVFRLMSFGDIYIFAYPNATIEHLAGDNPWIGLFGGFLSTFRLFPPDWLYQSIGIQFTRMEFPDLDLVAGGNPQHPIFGYHYFGGFAFAFSFILGLITVGAQTHFYRRAHSTFLSGLLAFTLYFSLVGISIDFEYALSRLASMIIGLTMVVGPVLVLRPHAALVRLAHRKPTLGASEQRRVA